MGLGKKSEVGEKELQCSISLVLHHVGEGETQERERRREHGEVGEKNNGFGKKKI
jgi:hypothetical protein